VYDEHYDHDSGSEDESQAGNGNGKSSWGWCSHVKIYSFIVHKLQIWLHRTSGTNDPILLDADIHLILVYQRNR
jgi:hypothetical protein